MFKTQQKTLFACMITAAALLFNGCETTNTSENAAMLAGMKTFHMENVTGALRNFGARDTQDVIVLTQEAVARQFEEKGYIEVPLSEPADFRITPGWTFYSQRNRSVGADDAINYDMTLQANNNLNMARLYLTVTTPTGAPIWEGSASWGIQTNINTASDFTQAASLAINGLPESTSTATATPMGTVPPMPPIPGDS